MLIMFLRKHLISKQKRHNVMNELDLTNIGITLHIKPLPWTLERTQLNEYT